MSEQTPNSDIVNLPGADRDVQAGVEPLTAKQQLEQLNNFFEDNYPEIFSSLVTDEGARYKEQSCPVPAELVDDTERMWARVPDLLAHSSLLVLGAGLDHRMPHVAYTSQVQAAPWSKQYRALPDGVAGTVLTPPNPTGAVAVSLHGGPGWFGDGASHDQFWLPLFASIAERSGVTIVDLTYPLPGYGAWDLTQQDVAEAIAQVKEELEPNAFGLIVFGSGLVAASQVVGAACGLDFLAALSPRIPEGFAVDIAGVPTAVSLAKFDSRGTGGGVVKKYFEDSGTEVRFFEYDSEHIIAAPAVWRQRVDELAEWLHQVVADC